MGMSLPVTSFYRELPCALYILILIKPYWPPPILWYFIPSFLYQHSSFSLHPRYPLVKERLYRDWSSYCQEGLADRPQVEFTSIHHNLNPGPQANWLMSSTFSQALFWVFYLISTFSLSVTCEMTLLLSPFSRYEIYKRGCTIAPVSLT